MWYLLNALACPTASLQLTAAARPLARSVRRASAAAQRDAAALPDLARALCAWHACLELLSPGLSKRDRRRLRRDARRQRRLLPRAVWRGVWLRLESDGWRAPAPGHRAKRPLAGKAARELRLRLRRQVRRLDGLAAAPPDPSLVRAALARLHRRACRDVDRPDGRRRRATTLAAAVELVGHGRGLRPQTRLDAAALAVPTERFLAAVEWDRFVAAAAYPHGHRWPQPPRPRLISPPVAD
ncbi:MAG: hypothetical protein RIB46_21665 [Pseudomonadales bacterium]